MREAWDLAFNISANIFRAYLLLRFCRLMFGKEIVKKAGTITIYAIFCACPIVFHVFFHNPIINLLINFICIFLVTVLYNAHLKERIICTILFYGMNVVCDVISVFALSNYHIGRNYNLISIYLTVLLIAFFEFLIEKTLRNYKKEDLFFPYWGIMLTIPVLSIALIIFLLIQDDFGRTSFFCLSLTLLWINIFTFFLYNHLIESIIREQTNLIYKMKAEEYAHQMGIQLASEQKVRSFRHDMRNHLYELKELINERENEKAIVYIDDMAGAIRNPKQYSNTGNYILDSMLNYLLREAEEKMIKVDISGAAPENLYISDFDLNIIIGNLVDNAMRAASESDRKWIKIEILFDKDLFHFYIKNSYKGSLAVDDHGHFISTKKCRKDHGLGIKNIKAAVKRNGGILSFSNDDSEKVFSVEFMLYMGGIM